MDILSSLGFKGYSNDAGAQKFDQGLIELKEKYPNLCKGTANPQTSRKPSAYSSLGLDDVYNMGSSFASNSSSSSFVLPKTRSTPTIDYSCSKLAMLDQPGNSFTAQPQMGKRKLKAIKKKLRDKTKGPSWFDIAAPEITDDRKNDLEALRLRGALDTKRFYKRNSGSVKPKYFQVGKIVGNAADFYNSRVTKKQRKRTIAEEMMAENNR